MVVGARLPAFAETAETAITADAARVVVRRMSVLQLMHGWFAAKRTSTFFP